MMLIVVMLSVWGYVVVGFIALALAAASPYFMDRIGGGGLAGIILIMLWPVVIGQTIIRARRFARARRVITRFPNAAHRAMERAAEREARNG